jgi:hypothetical protein
MARISINQALTYAEQAGFTGVGLITIVAIAMAESNLDTTVVNSIGATGILQIYLAVHPNVSSTQAKDPAYSFRYAYQLSGGGKNFCAWQSYDCVICGNCGKNGWDNRYKQYVPQVQAAFNSTQPKTGIAGIDVPVANAVNQLSSAAIAGVGAAKNTFSLASNASVSQALVSFDSAFTMVNPFDIDSSSIQQDNILGQSFPDPVAWLQKLGGNLIEDLVAITLRLICIALGIYLLFKVLDHYVDFSGAVQGATSTVSKLAPLLMGA